MKKITLLLLCCLCFFASKAQIDKLFWFAAPEVEAIHGDEPIALRFTSFDQPAIVTVSFPANPDIIPWVINLGANSTTSLTLTSNKAELENDVPNTVANKGLLIESTSEITAYYEVNNESNPDIFALKGRNGLGFEFYTPFQNTLNNYDNFGFQSFTAYSSIDIVATEDSTEVIITPSINLLDKLDGVPDTILLNRGQTYSVRAEGALSTQHPVGTHIKSNKRIAVTIKDDSVYQGTSYDLIGDQLIPVNVLGKEYILSSGRGYVLAVKDGTEITYGSETVILDKGEQHYIPDITAPILIKSTEPVYVLQISFFPGSNELGGAILPPLGCTGSRKIAVTKSQDGNFMLLIVVKTGAEGDFTINGDKKIISASRFSNINEDWAFAQVNMTNILENEQLFLLENASADFHLGIINSDVQGFGTRFGYFSDFGILDLGFDREFCEGDVKNSVLDAGISKDSYLWNTGETTQTIQADTGGQYIVTVTKGKCTNSDTIEINVLENVKIDDLGIDTLICIGDSLVLSPGGTGYTYVWQDNSKDSVFVAKEAAVYQVEVINNNGCSRTDKIRIDTINTPQFTLGNDTTVCGQSEYALALENGLGQYLWSDGSTDTSLAVKEPGQYSVNVTNVCGSKSDGIIVDFWDVQVPNIVTPNQDGKNDFFKVSGIETGAWLLVVRNRWGSEVYNNPSYQNTFSPEALSDGMYYYRLKEQSECNEFVGWLLIKR